MSENYSREDLVNFVTESNRIEGILRNPLPSEIRAHEDLWKLDRLHLNDVRGFVHIIADASLRDRVGYNVRVGNHIAPLGGPEILETLEAHIAMLNGETSFTPNPYTMHVKYETLHPFMDGNGRSGRALWAWQMLHEGHWPGIKLGFLHAFYYQTLENSR